MIRSVNTFFHAAFACIATALADGTIVTHAGQVLLLSALSAGIAAVWNGVLSPALRAVHDKADDGFKDRITLYLSYKSSVWKQ